MFYGRGVSFVPRKKKISTQIDRTPVAQYEKVMELKNEYPLKISILTKGLEDKLTHPFIILGRNIKFRWKKLNPHLEITLITTLFDIAPNNTQLVEIVPNKDIYINFKIRPKILPKTKENEIKINFKYNNKIIGERGIKVQIKDQTEILGMFKISKSILNSIYTSIAILSGIITIFGFSYNFIIYIQQNNIPIPCLLLTLIGLISLGTFYRLYLSDEPEKEELIY